MSAAHLVAPDDVPGITCSPYNSVNKFRHSNKSTGCCVLANIHQSTGMVGARAIAQDPRLPMYNGTMYSAGGSQFVPS